MKASAIYLILSAAILTAGYVLLISALPGRVKKSKYRVSPDVRVKDYLKRKLSENSADSRFREMGFRNVSAYKYNVGRLAVLAVLMILAILKHNLVFMVCCIIIVSAFTPSEKIFGIRSPFSILTDSIRKSKREKLDVEIYNACVILKNLAIVQKDSPWGGEFMIRELSENSNPGGLKPFLEDLLMGIRLGNDKEAFEKFENDIGTKAGREFAQILSKLDVLNPVESAEQIAMFQENLQEQKLTAEMRKAETRSNVVYTATTISILILIVNFGMIVIFMDAMSRMNNMSIMG